MIEFQAIAFFLQRVTALKAVRRSVYATVEDEIRHSFAGQSIETIRQNRDMILMDDEHVVIKLRMPDKKHKLSKKDGYRLVYIVYKDREEVGLLVEKHFILDRSIGGPDAAFSMEIGEFASMVKSIRNVENALGKVTYPTDPSMIKGREFSRSLYVAEDVKTGDVVTEKNVRSVRPGYGLHPKFLPEVLGKKFVKDCQKGERFELGMVE